jgi:hypothetical protein
MSTIRYSPTRVKQDSAYLSQFAANVTSQSGEDGIIAAIFSKMGARTRYCVEFGAWDGKLGSNSWALINNEGWSGLLIEGSREKFSDLQQAYAGVGRVRLMNRYIDLGENALDLLLREAQAPSDLDMVSIDIDGVDYHVWESLRAFRPRLVVIEYNPSIPNDIVYIQDPDFSRNEGNSLAALVELGKTKGYELVATTAGNGLFVVAEEFPKFGIADNHIDSMRAPDAHESRFFQLYDGTLVLVGCQHLIWHEIPISQENLQVLPPERRRFPGAQH